MIKLDNRLQAIADEIEGDCLADIGTDHGKVIVSSLLLNKVKRAIAVDISSKSLKKAENLAIKYKVESNIKFFEGNGLLPLAGEIPDCIVIAGMGANEIVNILKARQVDSRFILVAHQDVPVLREYLCKNGFFVKKDYVVAEGRKYYEIIVAEKGGSNYSQEELYIGKNLPSSVDFKSRLLDRKIRIEKIIDGIEKKSVNGIPDELTKELGAINKCLNIK